MREKQTWDDQTCDEKAEIGCKNVGFTVGDVTRPWPMPPLLTRNKGEIGRDAPYQGNSVIALGVERALDGISLLPV